MSTSTWGTENSFAPSAVSIVISLHAPAWFPAQSSPGTPFVIMAGCVQAGGPPWALAKKRNYGYRYRNAADG